jgi:DNA-binding MarR family transcriptional regulator
VLLLNELEDLGYIERRRDPADRRRHVVELTDAGRVALERAERAQEGLGDELFAALSDEERATLRSLLSRANV